jgi:hypothetical protein
VPVNRGEGVPLWELPDDFERLSLIRKIYPVSVRVTGPQNHIRSCAIQKPFPSISINYICKVIFFDSVVDISYGSRERY